jgi:hypothetical protein
MTDWWTIGIAYAAIVSTGALFLEIRRWVEAGPRLNIHVMPEAKTINLPGTEKNTYLLATVTNRGNAATTITHFVFRDYETWFNHLRSKPVWTAIVPDPHPHPHARQMSQPLQPGERWTGMALHHEELKRRMDGGYLYVVIFASHTDKLISKRVHRLAKPPQDAKEIP